MQFTSPFIAMFDGELRMFFCWLHLHFRWLHPGFHFQNKRFDFFLYIYTHFQNKHVHFQDLFFESTSDQPLVAVPPFFFQIPGTIFDAEQGSVALHQENHAAEVGSLQQAALLFLKRHGRSGLTNILYIYISIVHIYISVSMYKYTCTTYV